MTVEVRKGCLAALLLCGCARSPSDGALSQGAVSSVATAASMVASAPSALPSAVASVDTILQASRVRVPLASTEVRHLRFAWQPAGAKAREYEMPDPRDQHQIVLMPGVSSGSPPAVIALHGQPRRGQLPRSYEFPRVVTEVVRQLVVANEVQPLVLLLPRFRFEGQNWPAFALEGFLARANEVLAGEGIVLSHPYVFGHSGAAGCGGAGLNHVVAVEPLAVGFFDTCIGPGFVESATELARNKTPVLILHSVETAGFRPRQSTEYLSTFDFGRVYRPMGLAPTQCPPAVPDVPLRQLDYRCASNPAGTTRAFVVDTGEGEPAHNAVVPVGVRFFLKEYLGPH